MKPGLRIGLYKGKSILSRIIKFRTWGKYSHASIVTSDLEVYESWYGVRHVGSVLQGHSKGTEVDLYNIKGLTVEQEEQIIAFCTEQLGKGYDYFAIIGFVLRRNYDSMERWFCSELVHEACKNAGVILIDNVESYKVDPTLLSYSPILEYSHTVTTTGR
jgi:uncharacterized protein YycO